MHDQQRVPRPFDPEGSKPQLVLLAVDFIHGSTLVMYSAGISACEKGGQWPEALSLLREMGDVKLEPDVVPNNNAAISACERGWH